MDNKKLTKILLIAGAGLLILFIGLRFISGQISESPAGNPDIKNTVFSEIKLPAGKSNQDKISDEQKRKQKGLQGEEKEKYVYSNFNQLVKTSNNPELPTISLQAEQKKDTSSLKQKSITEKSNTYASHHAVSDLQHTQTTSNNNEVSEKKETKSPVNNGQEEETGLVLFGTVKRESNPGQSSGNLFQGIKAEIYGDQKIPNGGSVKIRLKKLIKNDGGITLPENSILWGVSKYTGNRVKIHINKADTQEGSFVVNFDVLDNDNLEGINYKAPIDEVKDDAIDNTNPPAVNINPGVSSIGLGGIINQATQGVVRSGKNLVKKSRALQLPDAYCVYIIPGKKKE